MLGLSRNTQPALRQRDVCAWAFEKVVVVVVVGVVVVVVMVVKLNTT